MRLRQADVMEDPVNGNNMMQAHLDLITHCANHRGPHPAHYANLSAAFTSIADHVAEGFIENMVRNIQYYQAGPDEIYGLIPHMYAQPLESMGDFQLLAKFYDAYDQYYHGLESTLRLTATAWDQYVLSLPCAQSLFNRETYLLNKLAFYIEQTGATSILDVACGDGRLLKKLMTRFPHLRVTGFDHDPLAIQRAKWTATYQEQYHQVNALETLPHCEADIVISAGLFDYLSDALGARLIRQLHQRYHPRWMVMANLTHHDSASLMSLLNWRLQYRTPEILLHMSQSAVAPLTEIYHSAVEQEPLGINLFLIMEHLC